MVVRVLAGWMAIFYPLHLFIFPPIVGVGAKVSLWTRFFQRLRRETPETHALCKIKMHLFDVIKTVGFLKSKTNCNFIFMSKTDILMVYK